MPHILIYLATSFMLMQPVSKNDSATRENWQIFKDAVPPAFQIVVEKSEYLPGEAIAVRCILQNNTESKIPVHWKKLERASYSVSLGILEDLNRSAIHQPGRSIGTCWSGNIEIGKPVYLEPGERVIGDFILGTLIETPGSYYITATYFWREHAPDTPNEELFKYQFIKAEPIPIKVHAPSGEDADASRFFPIPRLLNYLQSPLYDCTRLCNDIKNIPCEDTKEFYWAQGRRFLERFPKSAYARYLSYTAGIILRDMKNYPAAEEQFGTFIAAYPEDRMVDNAMFEMAECQIEQGKPDKAQAILESLFQKYPLTSAHGAKRVLENLKKGYKTMGEIYGH